MTGARLPDRAQLFCLTVERTVLLPVLASLGITPTQFAAMRYLKLNPGRSVSDLAEALHSSRPAAANLSDRLVRQGLACRHEDEGDRRRVKLQLTPEGLEAYARVVQGTDGRFAAIAQAMGPDELGLLVRGVDAFVAAALATGEAPDVCRRCGLEHDSACPAAGSDLPAVP